MAHRERRQVTLCSFVPRLQVSPPEVIRPRQAKAIEIGLKTQRGVSFSTSSASSGLCSSKPKSLVYMCLIDVATSRGRQTPATSAFFAYAASIRCCLHPRMQFIGPSRDMFKQYSARFISFDSPIDPPCQLCHAARHPVGEPCEAPQVTAVLTRAPRANVQKPLRVYSKNLWKLPAGRLVSDRGCHRENHVQTGCKGWHVRVLETMQKAKPYLRSPNPS